MHAAPSAPVGTFCLRSPTPDFRALGTAEVKGILGERSSLEYQGWVHRCVRVGSSGQTQLLLLLGQTSAWRNRQLVSCMLGRKKKLSRFLEVPVGTGSGNTQLSLQT